MPTAAGCLPSGSGSTGRSFTIRSIFWRRRPSRLSSRSTSTGSSAPSGHGPRRSRPSSSTRRSPTTRSRVAPPSAGPPDPASLRRKAEANPAASAWREVGDALTIWGGAERPTQAIDAYARALALDPRTKMHWFRLGVAHRMRHESPGRRPGDFQAAIDAWCRALELDPNQYIWRRRIEQYGPRLAKPYAFYDWVAQAKAEVSRRGEMPVALTVEPYGSELAGPVRDVLAEAVRPSRARSEGPDPSG